MEKKSQPSLFENVNARIQKVQINGLQRTKDDYVMRALNDVFKVKTFQNLLEKAMETRLKLEKLGCFKNISVVIDTSKGSNVTSDLSYDVTFNVKELNKFSGHVNTTIENNQPSLNFVVQTPNLAGRGEVLQSSINYNSRRMQAFKTSFIKPLRFSNGSFTSSIFKQNSENIASGYKLNEYGALFSLLFNYTDKIMHKLEYESTVRKCNTLDKNVAFPIREASGYSLKSSIRNSIQLDSRDSAIFPTTGALLRLTSEFAGLGGNIGFLKNEFFSQINIPFLLDTSLQASFGFGILNNTTTDKYYSIMDRFFLGGPLTLRGFSLNGAGPQVDNYFTGGSMYCLNSLHLFTPLPHRPKKGTFGDSFRIHFFCNAGNLANVNDSLNECIEVLKKDLRLSYGVGLVYKLGKIARIELNYCIPMLHKNCDKLVDGIQLGIDVQL